MSDILVVRNLTVTFRARMGSSRLFERTSSFIKAVDNVSFGVGEQQTFGLAGETGSGKSTIGKVLVGLHRPTSGSVKLLGREINFKNKKDIAFLRRNIGIVLQDPVGSLNPRLKVREIVKEALIASKTFEQREHDNIIEDIILHVGLGNEKLDSYPKDLSGGEKQRVSLARALVVPKKLLVLDEPTSSLDVSIQAQVLNTLRGLKKELGLSYIFITHDINVIKYMSDFLGILYYGKMLEVGKTRDVVTSPKHPYTTKLISNVLGLQRTQSLDQESRIDEGPAQTGCIYRNACPQVFEKCGNPPPAFSLTPEWSASCFLYEDHRQIVA
jgi:oligopeptide/dipeptide ABC transporter ATP-binding protein